MKKLLKLLLLSGFTLIFANQFPKTASEPIIDFNSRFPDCDQIEWSYCDPNEQGDWFNILDIVFMVNIILGYENPTDSQLCASDFNEDEAIDVLDILLSIECILE